MTNAEAGTAPKLRVVLSNSYGTLNVGDEAILTSMVDYLSNAGVEVDILTYTPDATGARHPAARAVRSGVVRGVIDTCRAIRKADLLVVGGGGILQDATSLGNLLLHVSRPFLARVLGTPTIVCGVGVGPLHRRLSRRLTATNCQHAKAVSVRDQPSAELLAAIGVPPDKVHVAADLALMLSPLDRDKLDAQSLETLNQLVELKRNHQKLIGLSLRPPIGVKAKHMMQSAAFRDRLSMFAEVADELVKKNNAQLVFISMHPEQDYLVGRELRSLMKQDDRITLLPGWLPPRVTCAAIGSLDLMIGMRLHSLIFASMAGVPMIALGYDKKVASYLSRLGIPGQVLPEARWQNKPILELTDHTLANSEVIRTTMNGNLPALRSSATQCMESVVQLGRNLAEHQ